VKKSILKVLAVAFGVMAAIVVATSMPAAFMNGWRSDAK
jgi:hypothetical protein